jgi:hypothetical protein
VSRVGEGSEALSGATGNTMYLDQFTTNGAYVSTIMIPDTGAPADIFPGGGSDWMNEAFITLSSNKSYINFAGYNQNYPFAGADVTIGGAGYSRGIGAVNGYGYYALVYTNYGLYSGGRIRDVYSTDGLLNFWTSGSASSVSGLKYVNAGPAGASYQTGNGIPTIGQGTDAGGPLTGAVCMGQIATNIVFTDIASADTNVAQGSTSSGYLALGLDEFSGTQEGAGGVSSNIVYFSAGADFAMSTDLNTVYVADTSALIAGGTGYGGGVHRFDLVGGVYTYQYTLQDTTGGGTNGTRGLAVNFPTNITTWGHDVNGATIYATTSEQSGNRLIGFTDNGLGSASTLLATAGTNQYMRGVRFAPVIVPLSIATQPASQAAMAGQEVDLTVVATGTSPTNGSFVYQWYENSAAIAGATSSVLSFTNVQTTNAGTYYVTVNNGNGSPITSSNAVLTVGAFNPNSELVGWWKLNDGAGLTAADSSVFGDSGSLTNFPADNSEWVTGLGGSDALSITNADANSDNAVVIPDEPQLNFSNNVAFTLACWIMPYTNYYASSGGNSGALIAKGYGNGGEQYVMDITGSYFRFFVKNASGVFNGFTVTNTVTSNVWQHVAATYDGYSGLETLYVNGQMITNAVLPGSLLANAWPVSIGNRVAGIATAYNLPFFGVMQDARIYNVCLGPQNIQAIYNILAPAIAVYNGSTLITNGQTSPAVSFGSVAVNGTGPAITFTITNSGNGPLAVEAPIVPSGYTVTVAPPATIAAKAYGTFTVQLSTTATGVFAGNVSIANSSAGNPFTFAVTGTVITAVPPSFAAIPISGAPGAPVLHISGSASSTYRVWSTTNLALKPVTTQWTLVGTGVFTGGADTFACPASGPAAQYYTITQP